jgi:hypothetical protein
METTHSTALATAGRVLVGVAVTAGAAFHALLWLFVAGFQCDESCDGVLTLAFAVAFAVRSSPRWLTIALAASAAATAIAPWVINAT